MRGGTLWGELCLWTVISGLLDRPGASWLCILWIVYQVAIDLIAWTYPQFRSIDIAALRILVLDPLRPTAR